MSTHLDSLIYKLEAEVSGRKIAEIVKGISALGPTASKAIPILQKTREKVLHEDRYKYTRKMVISEIEKALAAISGPAYWEHDPDITPPTPQPSISSPSAELVRECPHCGTHLQAPASEVLRFCTRCGAPLEVTPIVDSPSSYCSSCGAEVPDNARFCVKCGTAVS